MTEEEPPAFSKDETTAIIVKPDYIEKHRFNDAEIEKTIIEIVDDVIHGDIRLENTPEVREALRDYVRIEILFAVKVDAAIKDPSNIESSDERMIRSCAKIKMDLRNELWQNVRAQPGKDRVINVTRELIQSKVIKAAKEVDPLG